MCTQGTHYPFTLIVKMPEKWVSSSCGKSDKQANSENLCPPPRIFLRNKESSANVKFIRGVTLTRYILSTYVDGNNA